MRNILFNTYESPTAKILGRDLPIYNSVIENLFIEDIQQHLNRKIKVGKIMLFLTSDIDSDNIIGFRDNFYDKKPMLGIISIYICTKNLNWETLNSDEKNYFLSSKWKLLFSNLSDNYFLNSNKEVLKYFDNLHNII